ncbi:MAG: M1 family metallopeptidase [Hyphomonadaceae bacterium]
MLFRPFAFLLLVLALAAPSAAQDTSQRQWFESGPTPLRYEIAVTPDVEAAAFAGQARIIIESDARLQTVTMNALDLEVERASIDGARAAFALDAEAQTLTLTPRRALAAGRHTIDITYRGHILDDAYGLFRVEYQDGGVTKRALATQFEAADARRFAPMWDQPNRRAVFQLTVTAPADQMVISNMPAAQTHALQGGLTRTTFQDTPPMPSYLLFFGMGDFERITADYNGIEVGVVVRRGQTERGRYALQAGVESLRYFTEYYNIDYPLPKLDMIGVPGAGGFGAMENWGAILYFDQYLLLDDAYSSETDRQTVFNFVAHEVAHQWFGNLVTMTWWDDLWLNEGFASWMSAKAQEAVHPDWQPWMQQLTDGTSSAMSLDSRIGTHPIVQTVNTIDEANLAFDTITYEKGLAVIRMLEAYVGEEDFRQGVRDYLNAQRFGNARTEDLWTAVQAASGQPVLDIARSFTGQPGFPLLTAAPCAGRAGCVSLTQRRFAMDDVSRTDERWEIPVVAQRLGAAPVRAVMPAEASTTLDVPGAGAYVVNAGQSGFFRVLYDDANFAALTHRFRELDGVDQLGLMLDYWAFGRSGDASFANYMELVNAMGPDADPVIVADVAGSLVTLADYARGRPSEETVRAYGRRVLAPYFAQVGWTPRAGENSNVALLRATLISALGGLGDEAVIAEARRRVAASESDPSALPGVIRDATLRIYATSASEAEYDALLERARTAPDFVEQRRVWRLLASARNPALAQRTLQFTLTEEIPRQIRPQVLSNVASAHPQLGWDFLVAHRADFEAMLDPLQRLEYPPGIAQQSSDPAMAEALERYASNFPEGAMPTVHAAAAAIRLRGQTVRERFPAAEAWIVAHERRSGRRR